MKLSSLLFALFSGALFGAGLTVSTMIQPQVVLAFLRGQDMGLLLVLGPAVVITMLAYQFGPRLLPQPWTGGAFCARPSASLRDTYLGAAIFGVGWGIAGVCPGPAIAGLGAGLWPLLIAVMAIALGAWVQGVTARA